MRPSPRLVRAVTAERADLERQRAHLAREAADLRAALARIEQGMAEIDEQCGVLDRLVPAAAGAAGAGGASAGGAGAGAASAGGASAGAASADGAGGASAASAGGASADGASTRAGAARDGAAGADAASGGPASAIVLGGAARPGALRGPAIREVAVRLLVAEGLDGLHYREWFDLLTGAGHAVAGKDPLAVFLTQLTRSPVVRKSATPGRYELDRQADQRLKRRIDRLHREYLSATRANRTRITAEIAKTERQLDEAQRALRTQLEDAA